MSDAFEVPEPILNSPFDEPAEHWHIVEGETPERRPGRRPAVYFYRDPKAKPSDGQTRAGGLTSSIDIRRRPRS